MPVPNLVRVLEKSRFLKENEEIFEEIREGLDGVGYKKIFSMAVSFERKKQEGKQRREGRRRMEEGEGIGEKWREGGREGGREEGRGEGGGSEEGGKI